METPGKNGSYSANVQMHLNVNDLIFSIGQLGPDFLILDDPADHPPADGVITFSIDGRVRTWSIYLPDGIISGQGKTRTSLTFADVNGSTVAKSQGRL
jgi:hypothetical protein